MKRKENFLFFLFMLILLSFGFGISGCGPADTTTTITAGGGDVVTDTQPPTTPTGLVATAVSASQINLKWTPSSDDVAVTGYIVKRDSEVVGAPGSNGFADIRLEAETEYCYSVAAYDAAGNQSGYTELVCATTLPEVVQGEWKLPFGYIGYSVVSDDVGNAYIGGGYDSTGNPFIARINANGTVAWIVSTPGTAGTDRGNGITISPDGKYIYLKYFFDIFSQTSSEYREFVNKYSTADGTLIWSHEMSTPCGTNGSIGSIAIDSSGAIYAAGVGCVTKLTDNGESVSEEYTVDLLSAADVFVPAAGNYYYSTGSTPVDGYFSVTFAKYRKSDGAVEWEREWARALSSEITNAQFGGESICVNDTGTVFVGTSGWYYDESGFVHL
ncbi:MAG: fibronectin type III domain-containing protein [bacterium]|nr:fibronectin type III domain-containing protein [bacterium]